MCHVTAMNREIWIIGMAVAVVAWFASPTALNAATDSEQEAAKEEKVEELKQRVEEARARLNLTDEQIEQITPILEEGFEAIQAVLEKHGIDLSDRSGQRSGNRIGLRQLRSLGNDLDEARADTYKKLEASGILSDEQLEEYKKLRDEQKEAMRDRIRGRRGGG